MSLINEALKKTQAQHALHGSSSDAGLTESGSLRPVPQRRRWPRRTLVAALVTVALPVGFMLRPQTPTSVKAASSSPLSLREPPEEAGARATSTIPSAIHEIQFPPSPTPPPIPSAEFPTTKRLTAAQLAHAAAHRAATPQPAEPAAAPSAPASYDGREFVGAVDAPGLPLLKLSGIAASAYQPAAFINGRVVVVGNQVAGLTITKIADRCVQLRGPRGTITLYVP